MTDTYANSSAATADATLPPLTAAIRKAWADAGTVTGAVGPVPSPAAMRAILDAVHALEDRVTALEP